MADSTQGLAALGDLATKLQSGTANSAAAGLDVGSLLGNIDMTTLVVSLVAGLVGSAYFVYGKKTSSVPMLVSGAALCIVPYFISNAIILTVACLAMAAAPFFI
jgi:hypothetical protein